MSGYLRRYVYQSWHGPISNRHDIKHRLLRIIHPHAHETLRSGKPRGHSHSPSDPRRIQCQSHLLFLMKLTFNRSATKLQAISLANRHSMPYLRWFECSSLNMQGGIWGVSGMDGMGWFMEVLAGKGLIRERVRSVRRRRFRGLFWACLACLI